MKQEKKTRKERNKKKKEETSKTAPKRSSQVRGQVDKNTAHCQNTANQCFPLSYQNKEDMANTLADKVDREVVALANFGKR